MPRRGKKLLTETGQPEPQEHNLQGLGDLMPGYYWIRHPDGTRFVGLYEPPCWYAPGVEKAIPVKPNMIISPAVPPDVAEQLQPLTESCMKLAGVILAMDAAIGPLLGDIYRAAITEGVSEEKRLPFEKVYNGYKAILNDAFNGTVVEMSSVEMVEAASNIMSMPMKGAQGGDGGLGEV